MMIRLENCFAYSKASFAASGVLTLIVAPLPWFPSSGLNTSGNPTLLIASSRSSISEIVTPLATGIAESFKIRLVSS
jgi:hypothetical protein